MAYSTSDIKQRAAQLLGLALNDTQAAAMGAVCEAAAKELEARLRQGVSAQELGELFVTAAGLLAISLYIEVYGAQEEADFSAGNVSVSKKSGERRQSAAALRKKAELLLNGYLEDRGFAFLGVRG